MSIEQVVINPSWPTLSTAGRWLAILSVPWFFAVLFGSQELDVPGPDAPQVQRVLVLIVAGVPFLLLFFYRWVVRVPGLRWLLHRTQPRLVIRDDGIDLRLPKVGERHYSWDEIGGLRMRANRNADLLAPNGVALARLPESMYLAAGTWMTSESIAEVIVRARPDRYRLSRANWTGAPIEFALRDSAEPATTDPGRLVGAGRTRSSRSAQSSSSPCSSCDPSSPDAATAGSTGQDGMYHRTPSR